MDFDLLKIRTRASMCLRAKGECPTSAVIPKPSGSRTAQPAKRRKRAISERADDEESLEAPVQSNKISDENVADTDGFNLVASKAERKRASKEQASLDKLREEPAKTSKGVIKVTFRRTQDVPNGTPAFVSGTLMGLFK